MTRSMPDLRWSPATADANAILTDQVAGHHDGPVLVGRLCFRCASAEHGQPWARAGGVEVPVSLSRSGDFLVTAVGEPGFSVGVDVERQRPYADWPLAQILAPGESAEDADHAARLWVAKEAILKVEGVGLARPMTKVAIAEFGGILLDCDAPPGYLAAAALGRQLGKRELVQPGLEQR